MVCFFFGCCELNYSLVQGMKAVSLLTLVIGDKNDNSMAPGSSQVKNTVTEGRYCRFGRWEGGG